MDATRARPSLRWIGRLAVVAGLLLGGWLLAATSAAADSRLADLTDELVDRAAAGEDIATLIDSAFATLRPSPPQQQHTQHTHQQHTHQQHSQQYAAAPESEQTSSAQGSASSTPGVEVENTTTYGGVDYGPGPREATSGSVSNRVPPVASAPVVRERPAPPRPDAPPPAEPARAAPPVQAPAAEPPAAQAPRDAGARTAPAERPADPPAQPAPSAPAPGSSAGAAHDGGGQARGALGVLATRDRAATPSGGWPIVCPQVLGAAVEAAGSPTCRPD